MITNQRFVHPMVMEAAFLLEPVGEGNLGLSPVGVERLRALLTQLFDDPRLVSAVRALVTFAYCLRQDHHGASDALLDVLDVAIEPLGRLGVHFGRLCTAARIRESAVA